MTPGTRVTNSLGWSGIVTKRPAKWPPFRELVLKDGTRADPRPVVYVRWEQRKDAPGGDVLSHRPETLKTLPRESE